MNFCFPLGGGQSHITLTIPLDLDSHKFCRETETETRYYSPLVNALLVAQPLIFNAAQVHQFGANSCAWLVLFVWASSTHGSPAGENNESGVEKKSIRDFGRFMQHVADERVNRAHQQNRNRDRSCVCVCKQLRRTEILKWKITSRNRKTEN